MTDTRRETEWAGWMRAAILGDTGAYHRLLSAVTPYLRTMALRRCGKLGIPPSEAEDVVQEVLLAIHLKRATWDPSRPLMPWLSALVRNKLIDSLRRRGRRVEVPIEDILETLAKDNGEDLAILLDTERMLMHLNDPQRTIVQSISIEGASVRETASRLDMSEVAVRVSLHRALKALSARFATEPKSR